MDNDVNPRDYVGKQVYTDSLVHDHKALSLLTDVIGKASVCDDDSGKIVTC